MKFILWVKFILHIEITIYEKNIENGPNMWQNNAGIFCIHSAEYSKIFNVLCKIMKPGYFYHSVETFLLVKLTSKTHF